MAEPNSLPRGGSSPLLCEKLCLTSVRICLIRWHVRKSSGHRVSWPYKMLCLVSGSVVACILSRAVNSPEETCLFTVYSNNSGGLFRTPVLLWERRENQSLWFLQAVGFRCAMPGLFGGGRTTGGRVTEVPKHSQAAHHRLAGRHQRVERWSGKAKTRPRAQGKASAP